MKPKWLLQTDIFEENLELLCDEIKRQGMNYSIYDHKHFDDGKEVIGQYEEGDCVIVYGSLQMGQVFKRNSTFIPGVYCDLPKYDCTYYYPYFGNELINSNYVMLPFGELKRRKGFILSILGVDGCVFIRPNSGFKNFTGTVVHQNNWDKDIDWLGSYDVTHDTLVIVSTPRKIEREWRFVVVDDKIVSGSQYRNASGCKLDEPDKDAERYAQHILDKIPYRPERVWCLDICETAQGFHVLEVGCFGCAGLYVADKEPIVREVSRVALEEWKEYNED
jgi:hypothetical protein